MTFNFDGSACEYATCPGAPEMFIKIEEDGLYYFGVEADDKGSIRIGGDEIEVCEKTGERPYGKLELITGSRYLKAGYYKVALSYGNNAYDPTSGNAVAFNITMDREPIHAGKYEGNSTMKREFSPSPKIKLWTIEKESTVTCEESKEVEVEMERPEPVIDEANDDFKTNPKIPNIYVTACKDEANNVWRLRVHQVTAGTEIEIHTGGYRDALLNPPVNEKEAVEAVVFMNSYQESGRVLGWHTMAAAMAHENHHRREFEDAFKFYWKYLAIQDELEKQSVSCDEYPEMDQALAAMSPVVTKWRTILDLEATDYVKRLPDGPNDRPYCTGQAVLNRATLQIIEQAMLNGWNDVPTDITNPGTIEPPCFLPPVSEGKTRSMAIAEGASFLVLSIADTSRFSEGRITVRFRNEGSLPVRIPDEINDKTVDFFFLTVLRTEKGDIRILNSEKGKMTFLRPLNYRELVPGQEYSITIPLCLDEVDLAGWKQCSCELETRYYNQQGKDCFLGTLRAKAKLAL